MLALITGASSGIGKDMARILAKKGYDLILVARRKERMLELKKELGTNITVIPMDLSIEDNCFKLYEKVRNKKIDVLINNAGFGLFGEFVKTDLDTDVGIERRLDIDLSLLSICIHKFMEQIFKLRVVNFAI